MDKYKSDKIKSLLSASFIKKKKITIDDAIKRASDENILTLCDEEFFEKVCELLHGLKQNNIKGDIVLIGIWRGGAAIYIKQLMDDLELNHRVFLIDTYKGFSIPPNPKYTKDYNSYNYFVKYFPVTQNPDEQTVSNNFNKCNVSLNNVHFIRADLPNLFNQIKDIALLHIDVDMYEPTFYYLSQFFSKITSGGHVIIDDYGVDFFNCNDAVNDFFREHQLSLIKLNIGKHIASFQK